MQHFGINFCKYKSFMEIWQGFSADGWFKTSFVFKQVHMGFRVYKAALGQVYLENFYFLLSLSFHE